MDPNETLRHIREWSTLATKHNPTPEEYDRYCALSVGQVLEMVADLDEWLSEGGFLPDAWSAVRPKVGREERSTRPPTLSEANDPSYVLNIRTPKH